MFLAEIEYNFMWFFINYLRPWLSFKNNSLFTLFYQKGCALKK